MKTKSVFKRYEMKYLVTKDQKQALLHLFECYMRPDEYGQSSVLNLYYDTPDFLLIRRSLDNTVYKEKLRLRSYGSATEESTVFLELKKKFDDVVYKRRISVAEKNAISYFEGDYSLPNTQISKEIDYFKTMYAHIAPRVFIAYDREAFFGMDNPDFRVTFDENILWRDEDLSLCSEKYGIPMISADMALMEIKLAGGMPLWLTHFLTENKIYKTSFSKYGNAYKAIMIKETHSNAA